jgi:hypothetical protein
MSDIADSIQRTVKQIHQDLANKTLQRLLTNLGHSAANLSLTGSSLSLYTRGVVTRFLGEVLTSMPVCC